MSKGKVMDLSKCGGLTAERDAMKQKNEVFSQSIDYLCKRIVTQAAELADLKALPANNGAGFYAEKLRAATAEMLELKAERDELQCTLDLSHAADMRGIEMWQKETGRVLTWPDQAHLVKFLCEKVAALEVERDELKGREMGPQWRKEPPDEQCYWWWWNGDTDSGSIPVNIFAGYDERGDYYFSTANQHGWNRAMNVDKMGGLWMKINEPLPPAP
jgi:hypothetical protein